MTATPTAADMNTGERPTRNHGRPLGILGIGAAACAAWCVGPVLAFLGTAGALTAAGDALLGAMSNSAH